MKIAIPVTDGILAVHFGHCEYFALITVDAARNLMRREDVSAPPHEPGRLPHWLARLEVDRIIAGGMGGRAQRLFSKLGIEVFIGAPVDTPEALVQSYLAGTLAHGSNTCNF